MFTLYHGNRLELLADQLIEQLQQHRPADAFSPQQVLVPSNGMARWLRLRIARQRGICAQINFPLPAVFTWDTYCQVLHQHSLPRRSLYTPALLVWQLLELFEQPVGEDARDLPLRHYLAGADEARRYQLAARIADCFDQYLVYRPYWIQRWEQGEDHPQQPWQSRLWRRLYARRDPQLSPATHRVRLADAFAQQLHSGPLSVELHRPLFVFGVGSLAPPYITLLKQLSERGVAVHFFLLSPCQEYWADIRSERWLAKREVQGDDLVELHWEVGNPLLASLGQQGREFQAQLWHTINPEQDVALYHTPSSASLLGQIQADLLELRPRSDEGERQALNPEDHSLQIHACHGPLREVEVLQEQLLHLLQTRPGLSPADILVMTPDINLYAPYIEAVFGAVDYSDRRYIPFSIADQSVHSEHALLDTLFKLLDLPNSRFEASQILALLELPALQRRFGLLEADFAQVQDWVRQTAIRWGINAQQRAELGLPATHEHSWQAGLERLLLGYAMPAEEPHLFADILPAGIDSGQAQVLGHVQRFFNSLLAARSALQQARTPLQWLDYLRQLLAQFFLADSPSEHEALRTISLELERLAQDIEESGNHSPCSLALLREALQQRLEALSEGRRFLAGGVTFCAMVPLRSIPFRVLGLIGLNDGSYPRQAPRLGFDLIAQQPRLGDRSRREDDRYLFLEALLSAREVLYLSYVGASVRDNSSIPPSVLVSELIDYVRRLVYWPAAHDGDPLPVLRTQHPLQAFSRRYFNGQYPRLISYSDALCAASRVTAQRSRTLPAFWAEPLHETADNTRAMPVLELDWWQVQDWLRNPSQHVLRQRLQLRFDQAQALIEPREPFVLEGLARWQVRSNLLQLSLPKPVFNVRARPESPRAVLGAQGLLPHAQVGDLQLRQVQREVGAFVMRLREQLKANPVQQEALDFSLELPSRYGLLRFSGQLDGLSQQGIFLYRIGQVHAAQQLSLWVRHLLLHLLPAVQHLPKRSCWLSDAGQVALAPLEQAQLAQPYLTSVLESYCAGLQQPSLAPTRSALALVEAQVAQKDGISKARQVWYGQSGFADIPGEVQDPYHHLLWRHTDPIAAADFAQAAQLLFGPLLAQRCD